MFQRQPFVNNAFNISLRKTGDWHEVFFGFNHCLKEMNGILTLGLLNPNMGLDARYTVFGGL